MRIEQVIETTVFKLSEDRWIPEPILYTLSRNKQTNRLQFSA